MRSINSAIHLKCPVRELNRTPLGFTNRERKQAHTISATLWCFLHWNTKGSMTLSVDLQTLRYKCLKHCLNFQRLKECLGRTHLFLCFISLRDWGFLLLVCCWFFYLFICFVNCLVWFWFLENKFVLHHFFPSTFSKYSNRNSITFVQL